MSPAFGVAIGRAFERTKSGKSFLSIVEKSEEPANSLSDILEEHDVRWTSVLVESIRAATEIQLYQQFTDRRLRSSAEHQRLVATILSVDPEAAFGLMTVWSGHVREAATRAIASLPGPFSLALLVHRTNDWVPEVRLAAEQSLSRLRAEINPAVVVGCIEFLWQIGRFRRASDAARSMVAELLDAPAVLALLKDECLRESTDRAFRLFRWQLRTESLDGSLLAIARTHRQARFRATATRVLLQQFYSWRNGNVIQQRLIANVVDREALSRSALDDRSAAVQLAGLEYIVSVGPVWPGYGAALMKLVTSESSSVSGLSQWALTRAGIQWLDDLRSRFKTGEDRGLAITRVLGGAGDHHDGESLQDFASALSDADALPYLASAAKLKSAQAVARLEEIALSAPKVALSRRASKALKEAGAWLRCSELKPLADKGDEFFARGLGIHFQRLKVMDQLNLLARLERAQAHFSVDEWFGMPMRKINRGSFAPSESEQRELAFLLQASPSIRERARRLLALKL